MDYSQLEFLTEMRSRMFAGKSTKKKEIIDKLDELILEALKQPTQETE